MLAEKVIKFFKPFVDHFPRISTAYRTYRDNKYISIEPINTPMGFKFIGHEEMQSGRFEKEESLLIGRLLDDSEVFINAGANIGYYCCFALQKKKPTVAFEPILTNLRYLFKNIKANGWENEIEVFPIALSNRVGIIEIYGGGTGASTIKGFAGTPSHYATTVPCSTLDKIIGARFAGKKILVVMDIEGSEKFALEGGLNLIGQTPKPVWLVEILVAEHQPKGTHLNPNLLSTFKIFWDNGYDSWTATSSPRLVNRDEIQKIVDGGPDTLATHNFLFTEKGLNPLKAI